MQFSSIMSSGVRLFAFVFPSATSAISIFSLHDALPILDLTPALDSLFARWDSTDVVSVPRPVVAAAVPEVAATTGRGDRKSIRRNSSHLGMSYADDEVKKNKA